MVASLSAEDYGDRDRSSEAATDSSLACREAAVMVLTRAVS